MSDTQDKIYDNAKDFARAMVQLGASIETDVEKLIRKVVIDLYAAILKDWPRDTGRSLGSWNLSQGFIDESVLPEGYHDSTSECRASYQRALDKAKEVGITLDDVIWIVNNVEYAEALENGHSQQAPAGVVNKQLATFTRRLDEETRKYWWAA